MYSESEIQKKTVLDLSAKEAMDFFMDKESYCTLSLPKYFDFAPLLKYVKGAIGKREFSGCLAKNADGKKIMPSSVEDVNYKLLVNKDGKYAYRQMQIINPFIYYLIVREICNEDNWNLIKKRFAYFHHPNIEVASIPPVKDEKDKKAAATSVKNWWSHIEQRSIELSLKYKYMFVTDITNCYGSIYTHSIDWAITGKNEAKQNNKDNKKSFGHTLDTYFQAMQFGQTNGIPQGSVLSDFVAEIVLGYADSLFADALTSEGIADYVVLRFRDDYRIYSNDKDQLERIAVVLQNTLSGLNFQLNAVKTHLSSSVVLESLKPDKLDYLANIPAYKGNRSQFATFQQELLYILNFSQEYPNSGTITKLLSKVAQRMQGVKEVYENVSVLTAIVVEIARLNPKTYNIALSIISNLIMQINDNVKRKELRCDVYEKLKQLPNISDIQIWMQSITYQDDKDAAESPYYEKICRLVYGEDVRIWDVSWLDAKFTSGFKQNMMIDRDELDQMGAVIDIEDIALFDVYEVKS